MGNSGDKIKLNDCTTTKTMEAAGRWRVAGMTELPWAVSSVARDCIDAVASGPVASQLPLLLQFLKSEQKRNTHFIQAKLILETYIWSLF